MLVPFECDNRISHQDLFIWNPQNYTKSHTLQGGSAEVKRIYKIYLQQVLKNKWNLNESTASDIKILNNNVK